MSLTRRGFVAGALGTGVVLGVAACGGSATSASIGSAAIASAEATRKATGKVRSFTLTAQPATVDLGGTVVDTWAFGSTIPGKPLRATAGDRVKVAFTNMLPDGDECALARPGDPQRHGRRARRHHCRDPDGRDIRLRLRRPRPGYALVPPAPRPADGPGTVCAVHRGRPRRAGRVRPRVDPRARRLDRRRRAEPRTAPRRSPGHRCQRFRHGHGWHGRDEHRRRHGRRDDGRRRRPLPPVPHQRPHHVRPRHPGGQAGPEGPAADHQRLRRHDVQRRSRRATR